MKQITTLIAVMTLAVFNVNAQPTFQKTFAGSGSYSGTRASSTTNGIIVAGFRGASLSSPEDGVLMKTDLSGTVSWTKTYGGSGNDIFNVVKKTSDGGYIAAGYTTSSGAGGRDAFVVKTDASGTVSWAKTYGTVDDEIAYDIIQTSDGGYAFTGDAKKISANSSVGAISLVKLTSTGTESWTKMWGAGSGNYGTNIFQTADGGYLVGGRASNAFFSFIKTDGSGNITFARASKPMTLQSVDTYQMITTSDGGYAIVGTGDDVNNDVMIAFEKLDATCTVQWAKTYNPGTSGIDFGFGVNQAWNGGYCIMGYSGSFGPNFSNLYILNTSSTGVVSSAQTTTQITYGNSYTFSVSLLSDGGYVSTGTDGTNLVLFKGDGMGHTGCTYTTASAIEDTPNYFDNAITTWTSSGTTVTNTSTVTGISVTLAPTALCSGVGIDEQSLLSTVSIYPNPATDEVNIDLSQFGVSEILEMEIYNSLGQVMETRNISTNSVAKISLRDYDNGIYFVRLTNSDGIAVTRKIAVEK